ncbi:SMP-30/gluconolactonase/LRE family protein [Microbacterium sp. NPDC090218]
MDVVETVTAACTFHGEGPVWDRRNQRLLFVDMFAGEVLALDGAHNVTRHRVDANVAATIRPRADGGYLVGVEHGLVTVNEDLSDVHPLKFSISQALRMNEGGCDDEGRFYIGSMGHESEPKIGSLYRVDLDLSVHQVMSGITIPNGIQWSSNGDVAYYIDSATSRIDVLDFDRRSGTFGARRTLVHFEMEDGIPDGMTIDSEGGLWVAMFGASAVRRYDPDGALTCTIAMPSRGVTSCAFGGRDLDVLYVTTSQAGADLAHDRTAGSLLAVNPGIRGIDLPDFAG